MGLQIPLFVERFLAGLNRANKIAVTLMFFKMNLQALSTVIRLGAAFVGTHIAPQLRVSLKVVFR